jgi:molybdopterin synthase catalytic subunit
VADTSRFCVAVQEADFDIGALQSALLAGEAAEGAVATFTGYVRQNREQALRALELEHYPGMTEESIRAIVRDAQQRWPLLAASVVHRIGRLAPGDHIVWVGVAAAHREAAFSACEFIMDFLKTRAPFWKKESDVHGEQWVAARYDDSQRAARWGGEAGS